jgi:hypothetical protein
MQALRFWAIYQRKRDYVRFTPRVNARTFTCDGAQPGEIRCEAVLRMRQSFFATTNTTMWSAA